MNHASLLLADAFDKDWWNAALLALFWGFLAAALVWLVIWMLLWGASAEKGREQEDAAAGASGADDGEETGDSGGNDGQTAESGGDAEDDEAEPETGDDDPGSGAGDIEADDFLKLGLAGGTARALNGDGTLTYGQVADWSAEDIAAARAKYGEANPEVDFDQLPWKANALANGIDLDSIEEDDPAFGPPHQAPESVDHDAVIGESFEGEDVKNDQDLGVVYNEGAVAGHVDSLRDIKGVGPKLSNELNEYGVFCFKQIANWSDHNVAEFAERLDCFKNRIERDRWIPQAAGLECSDTPGIDTASEEEAAGAFADEIASGKARLDENYGVIYTEAPGEIDDLKVISGVGKVLEEKLHGIGVYRFKQVAFWTDAACKEFNKLLTFKDRLYRDNWIGQAKDLHEEKYGEKL